MEENQKRYFPLFINIENQNILIVGAGSIALRRAKTLLNFGAKVTMISESFGELEDESKKEMEKLIKLHKIEYVHRDFRTSDIDSVWDMVIAATNDKEVNEKIYALCKEQGILVNVASNRRLCDFFFPAVAMNEDVTVGIVGDGIQHQKVKSTAEDIRLLLEAEE